MDFSAGHLDTAVFRLRKLQWWSEGICSFKLGRIEVPSEWIDRMEQIEPGLRAFLENATTVEMLWFLAKSNRWDRVVSLVELLPEKLSKLSVAQEAYVLGLTETAGIQRGLNRAIKKVNEETGWGRLVFAVRTAQLLQKKADPSTGIYVLGLIEAVFETLHGSLSAEQVKILLQVARLALETKLSSELIERFNVELLNLCLNTKDVLVVAEAREFFLRCTDVDKSAVNKLCEGWRANTEAVGSNIVLEQLLHRARECVNLVKLPLDS
ncbi:hypothetical protein [Bradyrhizobium guangzhouense]|uniref:hypothetical protein n=1 Tax=Bradyrhizobium guangzhouense TaxID=1325095 RepID=UPI001008B9B5|nr:hypothetical protein [Bradyrhizobium guangzhouense]